MKKRSSANLPPTRNETLPEPLSSDFELDDSMVIQSDDGEVLSDDCAQALSPNSTIDDSMILSDEEEEQQQQLQCAFEDDADDQKNAFVSDDDEDSNIRRDSASSSATKPKKIWTGRTKKNYANPVNAATTALMVEDKPWRKASSHNKHRHPTTAATTITTNSAGHHADTHPSTPKSPSRHKLPVSAHSAGATTTSPLYSSASSSPSEAKRPLLKYIRGLATTQPSPRRTSTTPKGTEEAGGDWSDDDEEENDHSSVSSEMISYSSIDSMGESEDDLSIPYEDYFHHPESEPGFWSQLPPIPNHFIYNDLPDVSGAGGSTVGVPSILDNQIASHVLAVALPYLDPQFKQLASNDFPAADDFHFVLDHRFFLRALFQLLAERDEVGVEASIHDEDNIIKKGPLKKKYLGMVKVKYVELRRGNLVYYGDGDGEGRKTIHLRSATASCNAIAISTGDSEGGSKTGSASPTHPKGTISGSSADRTSSHGGSSGHTASSLSAGLTSAISAATTVASNTATGSSSIPGYEFHLWVEGKRYSWLASSKAERQSWVKAIRGAMIGDTINDDDWGMTTNTADEAWTPHEDALESYRKLQSQLHLASTSREYLDHISPLIQHPSCPSEPPALQIPLKWVSEQFRRIHPNPKEEDYSPQKRLKTSIAEFWYNMERFDFSINGHIINRESPVAAERIIGSLARCILDYDRCFMEDAGPDAMPSLKEGPGQSACDRDKEPHIRSDTDRISELDAVSYARTVLMMAIKSKISGDVEFAVDYLCQNEGLVRIDPIVPSAVSAVSPSPETLHLDVSFAGDDVVDHHDEALEPNEVSGWVKLRRSKYNSWKTRFCVFSEGVFSYYEKAKPRPHGLRGQVLLAGATLSEVKDEKDKSKEESDLYILRLTTKGGDRERQFGFKKEDEFLFWKESIQSIIEASITRSVTSRSSSEIVDIEAEVAITGGRDTSSKKSGIIENMYDGGIKAVKGAAGVSTKVVKGAAGSGMKVVKGAAGGGVKIVKGGTKVIKGATGGGMKAIKGATDLMFRSIRSKPKRDRNLRKSPSLQVLMESTRAEKTGKKEPTVQCVIQTTSDFYLRPAESGDEDYEDVWL